VGYSKMLLSSASSPHLAALEVGTLATLAQPDFFVRIVEAEEALESLDFPATCHSCSFSFLSATVKAAKLSSKSGSDSSFSAAFAIAAEGLGFLGVNLVGGVGVSQSFTLLITVVITRKGVVLRQSPSRAR